LNSMSDYPDIKPLTEEEREELVQEWYDTPLSKLPYDVWLKLILDMPNPTDK